MATFKDFYTSFGLKDYPFASFTTENESQKFDKTFIQPNDYETILENFSQKNSIILTGDRGTGKTALVKDFLLKVEPDDSLITHIIDFSQLKTDYELSDFYKFLITNFVVTLFNSLAENPKKIRKLKKEEKLLLSYLLKNFVPQISKRHLRERIEKIQVYPIKRAYKKVEKVIRGIFNYGATTGGLFIDEYIAKHFKGLPPLSESVKIKEFFPELPINVEEEFIDQDSSYQLLLKVVDLAEKCVYKRILIIFDRVDEDSRFSNDAEEIAQFIVKILTDNKLLLEDKIQIVFSTWLTPFNFIKDQVRTQKHYCPSLSWHKDDLVNALNKRLSAYSDGNINDYKSLFDSSVTQDEISQLFNIANRNPRDLWHVFNYLFRAQFEISATASKIQREAIPKALDEFVTSFNYYEYYPRKSNARANSMDIYSYAKHLLKLDSEVFTKNQLNEKAQTGGSTNNYVVGMERIGLITIESQQGGVVSYKIRDPKITYALKKGLEIKKE